MDTRPEKGVNTDELSPEELQKLVDNNRELFNEEISNIEHEAVEEVNHNSDEVTQLGETHMNKVLLEIEEKDKIIEILKQSNSELNEKIIRADSQYKEIITKLNERNKEDDATSLMQKIKETEKEIWATNSGIENFKKSIDSMKNKIEFKTNLERAINLENSFKLESIKNREIKKELDSFLKLENLQNRHLNTYDKENRISEKLDILKSEIKTVKDSLKDYQDKFTKQDKYLKGIHSRLSIFEQNMKKLNIPKIDIKKTFTKQDLKYILEILNKLKEDMKEKRKKLRNITKTQEDKLNNIIGINKKIEGDFKECEKVNKMLNAKKNELRRIIKTNEAKSLKSESKKKLRNADISHLLTKREDSDEPNPKLFSKNPNKIQQEIEEDDFANNSDEVMDEIEDSNVSNDEDLLEKIHDSIEDIDIPANMVQNFNIEIS